MITRRFAYSVLIFCSAVLTSFQLQADNRFALVIGNSQYENVEPLPNPVNDAREIARRTERLGFKVTELLDQTREEMRTSLRQFSEQLGPRSIVLFFYAGHGIQNNGKNYLIPVDADIEKTYEIERETIDLEMVLDSFKEQEPALTVAMLDACRNNPFEQKIQGISRSIGEGEGLAQIDVRNVGGMILSYATSPGSVASDGHGTGGHSPYTWALLKHLDTPGKSIQDMLNDAGMDVKSMTHGSQVPWISSSPVPRICLAGCDVNGNQQANEDDETTANVAERIRWAFAGREMARLKRLVVMDKDQEMYVRGLFDSYDRFQVDLHYTETAGGALVFKILDAINRKGNRVIPARSWEKIEFQPKTEG